MTLRTVMLSRTLLLSLSLALPALPAHAGEAPAAPARVKAVRAGATGGGRLVAATLVAAERATISTRIAATVRAVHVEEGRRVKAGDLLVTLAADDLSGALAAAEAGRDAAVAHERRIRALAAERAATPSELELAVSQRAQAEAAVAAARANLGYALVRAPFAGAVQVRRVEPGDLVGPGQPLLQLEGDGLELVANVTAEEARGLAAGKVVRFEAEGVSGEAEITALALGSDPLSHRRTLRARLRTADERLRSGSFARLALAGDGGGATTWVPRSALVERGDLTGVFVAAGGRAELRWISLGQASGEVVAVRAGLRPTETVIDAPGALRDGQPVEVLP